MEKNRKSWSCSYWLTVCWTRSSSVTLPVSDVLLEFITTVTLSPMFNLDKFDILKFCWTCWTDAKRSSVRHLFRLHHMKLYSKGDNLAHIYLGDCTSPLLQREQSWHLINPRHSAVCHHKNIWAWLGFQLMNWKITPPPTHTLYRTITKEKRRLALFIFFFTFVYFKFHISFLILLSECLCQYWEGSA